MKNFKKFKNIAAIALITTVLANECATLAELTNSNGDEFLIKTTPEDDSNEYIVGYKFPGGEMYGYIPNSLESNANLKTKFKIFGEKAKNGFRIMSEDGTRLFARKYDHIRRRRIGRINRSYFMLKPEPRYDNSEDNSLFTYTDVNNTLYGYEKRDWDLSTFPLISENTGNSAKDTKLQTIQVSDIDANVNWSTLDLSLHSKFCFRKISKQPVKCKIGDVQFDGAKFVGEQCAEGKELEDGETCVATCAEGGTEDSNIRYTCKDGKFVPSWTTPNVLRYENKPIRCLSITPTECAGLDELMNSTGDEYLIKAKPDAEHHEYIMGYKLTKGWRYDYIQHQTEANVDDLQIKFKIYGHEEKGFRIKSQDDSRIFSWNQYGYGLGFYMFEQSGKDSDDDFTLFTQSIDRRLGRAPNNDRLFSPLGTWIRTSSNGTEMYPIVGGQLRTGIKSKFCFQKVVSSGCNISKVNLVNAYLKWDTERKGENLNNGRVCTAKCDTNWGLETSYVCAAGKFIPSWITKNKPINCLTRKDVRDMKDKVKTVLENLKTSNGELYRSKTKETQRIIIDQIMENFENERKNELDVIDIEIEKELEKQRKKLFS